MIVLRVRRLSPKAKLPTKAYSDDAGLDLYALEDTLIYPINDTNGLEITKVSTGIAVQIPIGFYGQIFDKSGFVTRNGLVTVGGVIDSSYRGEVKVCFLNTSGRIITIHEGEKIAQMVILPIPSVEIIEVDKLLPTKRGENGFGSTGRF